MISPGPERVASYFTEDTIFKGPHPYSVGRQGIADYYGSQPLGMTATYKILETRRLASDLVLGYLSTAWIARQWPSTWRTRRHSGNGLEKHLT